MVLSALGLGGGSGGIKDLGVGLAGGLVSDLFGGGGGGSKIDLKALEQRARGDIEAAAEESIGTLSPYTQAGASGIAGLAGIAGQPVDLPAGLTPLGDVAQPDLVGISQRLSPEIYQTGLGAGLAQEALAPSGAQQLLGEVSGLTGELDPSVLADPAFQQAQQEAAQQLVWEAAGRGRLGGEEVKRAIARESLSLGRQFAQQDLQNKLMAQQQRFGQLQSALGFGTQEQGQRFQQLMQAGGMTQAEQAQRFGQMASQLGLETEAEQRQLANALLTQGQQFEQQRTAQQTALQNQLLGRGVQFEELQKLAQMGVTPTLTAAGTQFETGQSIVDLLTDIATAELGLEGAKSSAKAKERAGKMSAIGDIAGTIGTIAMMSDIRLKENITPLGDINGIPWFEFDYIDGPKKQYGTMAQYIKDDYPQAVMMNDQGYYMVNYGELPIWH